MNFLAADVQLNEGAEQASQQEVEQELPNGNSVTYFLLHSKQVFLVKQPPFKIHNNQTNTVLLTEDTQDNEEVQANEQHPAGKQI